MFNKIYEKIKNFIKDNKNVLIIFTIVILLNVIKLPYQVEMPGGTIDLNDRITINGNSPDIKGSFNMAYVSTADGTIPYVLIGLVHPDWEIVKNSSVKFDNESIKDAQKRDVIYLEQSKKNATVVALEAADIPYEINNKINQVMHVSEQADTDIKIGDEIISVDGHTIDDTDQIIDIVNSHQEGEELSFIVKSDGKEKEKKAKIYKEDDKLYVGISVAILYDVDCDIDIDIKSKSSESGPSGGMMMSLMIYNALTNQDLTHGKKIVGTGTINIDGTVGEIGGVKYKIMGAARKKADIFLVPKENYEEAKKVIEEKKYDIELVSLETLQDAIDYLEGLDD